MSLTKFVSIPEVKRRINAEFALPSAGINSPILAPPVTKNYGLVGTAFDYLIRFYFERLNTHCLKEPWVAEQSVKLTKSDPRIYSMTSSLLDFTKKSHQTYIRTGNIDENILKSVIYLAQLDTIYRASILDPNLGKANPGDTSDLRSLLKAVKPDLFKAREICILNPTFGIASLLVGRADADLLIDDTLIDIKTTKRLEFTREYFGQLVGYFVLNEISGQIGSIKGLTMSKMGIYFPRYGILYLFSTDMIRKHLNLPQFVSWFTSRAKAEYSTESVYL